MGDLDFVVIDFETTGLGSGALPVEIGMVRVSRGQIAEQFDCLIKQDWISPAATQVHGLSVSDLRDAPTVEGLIGDVQTFVKSLPIVMHNAAFDMQVAKTSGLLKAFNGNRAYCSLHLAQRALSTRSHTLQNLAAELKLKHQPNHRALSDALSTAELVLRIIKDKRFVSFHDLYVSLGLWNGTLDQERYKLPRRYSKGSAHISASVRASIAASIADDEWVIHNDWVDQEVCFTGALESMAKSEAHLWAMRMGAQPRKSINKKCRFVVVGSEPSQAKLLKITELRSKGSSIVEIDEEQFLAFIEEAKEISRGGEA